LWGALALAPLVYDGVRRWDDALVQRWAQVHRRRIRRGQRVCRMVAWGLRRPWMARTAVRVLAAAPALARPLVMHTSVTTHLRRGRA
ncbi:MAG: hypothetical protein VYA48_04285, partial [Gemmatimonadota bacterium]|nr:hypothetical protein [Gemmatimonadota bacterium]